MLEALARNYLALPHGVGVAVGRLLEGAKLPGNHVLQRPLKVPDGTLLQNISFAQAAEVLQRYSATVASGALPDFKLPLGSRIKPFLPEDPQTTIADVDQLLLPPRELRGGSIDDNLYITAASVANQRIVTWTDARGLAIYPVGQSRPLGTNPAITENPRGIVWVGQDLIVWTASKISLLRGDNAAPRWELVLKSLPKAEAIAAADPNEQAAQRRAPNDLVVRENQQVRVLVAPNGQQIRVVAQGVVRFQQQPQAPRAVEGGDESIEHVRPIGDRVIVATSIGRFVAIDLATGQVPWQARVGEAALDQVVANDDFVAARFVDDFGPQIVALDTFTGQVVWQRTFAPDPSRPPPLNMALSPDGTLIYTIPDRLCAKDLYEPTKELKFGENNPPEPNQWFNGAVAPEQLIVASGRALAVSDNGQFVRVLSLENGLVIGSPLATGTGSQPNNWNVWLRTIGPRLYVINQKTVMGYNLDIPDESWPGFVDPISPPVVRDAFIGRNHIVLLDQGGLPGAEPAPATHFKLLAYARYPKAEGSTMESGRLDYFPVVTHSIGIDQWQGVEGGFYYRTLDRKLHYLRGAAP